MRCYTTYLKDLCAYLKFASKYDKYQVTSEERESFEERLTTLAKSFRKGEKREKQKKSKEESNWIKQYLTQDNIDKFRTSSYHCQAVQLFEEYLKNPNKDLVRKDYTKMRDLIIHYCRSFQPVGMVSSVRCL